MIINHQFEPDSNSGNSGNDRFALKAVHRSNIPESISPEEFHELLFDGRIVDARAGGMILGKKACEGGPRGIFRIGTSFLIQGQFSGGDFILNKEAAVRNMKRLRSMNAGTTMREIIPEAEVDECNAFVISTSWPHDRLLWMDFSQMVVHEEPAQKHLVELVRMNMNPNPYTVFDLYQAFNCDPGTPDGIV